MSTILPDSPDADHTPKGIAARLRGYFLTGIVVTAPIAVTLYITWSFLTFIDTRVGRIIPIEVAPGVTIPGGGVILAVAFFILVGWFARNYFGKLMVSLANYTMERVPVIRTIYSATRQVFEMLMGHQAKAFREVVLVEFPRKDCWSIAFVTGKPDTEIHDAIGGDLVTVFVPHAPTPTGGFVMFVHRSDLRYLKMTVDEGIKFVVTCGIIMPNDKARTATTNAADITAPRVSL